MQLRSAQKTTLLVIAICAVSATGCASNKIIPIPASYRQASQRMSVKINACPRNPNLPRVGGGVITMAVLAIRQASTKEMLGGVSGSAVQDLVQQEVERGLATDFEVEDSDTPLVTEVKITHWGLNSNSTVAGIKTSGWYFQIMGNASVFERTGEKPTKIGYARAISSSDALGNDPSPQEVQEAMLKAVDAFGQFIVYSLVPPNPAAQDSEG